MNLPPSQNSKNLDAAGEPRSQKPKDLVAAVRQRLQDAYEADRENRRQAALDLSFLAGDQWDTVTSEARRKTRRPMLTINRLPTFVGQVANDIRQADLEIKAVPVEDEDKGLTETYNGILRQIQYRSAAKSVFATAVSHQVSCGMGYFRVTTDYVDDASFDQEIKLETINNPLSVYFDPAAVRPDRADAMWCIVTEEIPRKTFSAKYPKKTADDISTPSDYVRDNLHWFTDDKIRIAEYWVKEEIEKTIYLLPDGTTTDDEGLKALGLPPDMKAGLKTRKVKTHKIKMWLLSGEDVLEGPYEWAGKYIPIIPVMGQEVPLEHFRYRYGLIRFARDAQQLYNYYRTAAAEWINLAPKAPFLVTERQIGEYKRLWDDHHLSPRPYLVYEHDPEVPQGPTRQPAPELPSALLSEAQVAVEDLKATTGIFDASLGNQTNERTGKAIQARQAEGDTANFHYIDNLNQALEYCGKVLIDLIPKIYDTDRVMRLIGENDKEKVVAINRIIYNEDGTPIVYNDLSAGRFDIRVKIGPSYRTKRMETSEQLMNFVKHYPPAAQVVGDLIAKNMDFPGAEQMAKRLEAMVPPQVRDYDPDGPPPPPQPPPPEVQMEQQKMQMEMQKEEMRLQGESGRQQSEQQKLQMQMEFERQRHEQRMYELAAQKELEEIRLQLESYKLSLQGAAVEHKAEVDAEMLDKKAEMAEQKMKAQRDKDERSKRDSD